ncbi:MAG: hypothetical protein KKF88_11755 [Alphaproteobacteria bacterium]|nr:hypothetical protein [Alphaproteobacteria bacterium]
MTDAAQKAEAEKAMKLKAESAPPAHPDPGQTADEGMQPTHERDIAPSGALDAEGHRPVLERSRKVR